MFGSSKGFTLIEVLVATILVALFFGFLFELLGKARRDFAYYQTLYQDLLMLNNKVLLDKREGISIKRERLKDYPNIEEQTYTYGSAEIYIYVPRE